MNIKALRVETTNATGVFAPSLPVFPGCGALAAAKIVGETADVDWFTAR